MDIAIVDLETTGLDPEKDRIVEVAWCPLDAGCFGSFIVDPQIPISAEASAVHHLTDACVAGQFTLEGVSWPVADIFAAHNSRFELAFLQASKDLIEGSTRLIMPDSERASMLSVFATGDEIPDLPAVIDSPWIDTYRCALRIWPDAPRHSNQVLRYWLGLNVVVPDHLHPHRAAYDVLTTAPLLREMLQYHDADQLIAWSSEPALLPRVTFGKHAGEKWSEVPASYLRWMAGKMDEWDEDTQHTIKFYI